TGGGETGGGETGGGETGGGETGGGETGGGETGGGETGGGGGSSGLCADVDFAAIDRVFPTLITDIFSIIKSAVHYPLVNVNDYINNKIKPVKWLFSHNKAGFDYYYSDILDTTVVGITKESDGKYSLDISYYNDATYDSLKPTDAPLRLVEVVKSVGYIDAAITQDALDDYRTALKSAGFKYELVNGTDDEYAYIKKSGNCEYRWSDDISFFGTRTLFSWIILDSYLSNL
ncbi:MAG: hypothetical protein LBS73_05005, partial [Campylobacteraceae bacterium]|nr:hypothetical protein [Campylobacteraceae bacterium]